jgi:hypothetical protein
MIFNTTRRLIPCIFQNRFNRLSLWQGLQRMLTLLANWWLMFETATGTLSHGIAMLEIKI